MKKILVVLCIGFFCVLLIDSHFENTEAALSRNVIRLHVVANSDTDSDQELKLKVRDRIIEEMDSIFDENTNVSSAREAVRGNMDMIKRLAEDEIRKNGYSYDVNVDLGKSSFPTKEYGEIVLPAGSYEALKVKIGKAKGENWWCVLFPPLCFVDETAVSYDTPTASKLAASVGDENAKLIKKEKSPEVELKFKAYEVWQKGKQKLAALLN